MQLSGTCIIKAVPLIDVGAILDKCKKNDRRAQEALYYYIAPKLLGVCLRYFADRAEAEDIMQDSLVKIFTNLNKYNFEGSFEGWCKRLTINVALNRIKVNNRMLFDRNLQQIEDIEFENDEVLHLNEHEIIECLNQLADGYRTIVNLFLFEHFSHKEIADRLDITESTSRSQYARARQQLATLLKEKIKSKNTHCA